MQNNKIQNKKVRKRSSEKQFMKTMIITGIVGLSVMMISMLYIIKIFGTKKVEVKTDSLIPIVKGESKEHIVSTTIRGVIHDINQKNRNINVWDIQESQYIKMQIKDKTELKDSYGKPMSLQEVQVGEIVEITYEEKSKDVGIVQKSANAWVKPEVSNIDINIQNKKIKIGNTEYDYTSNMLITNDKLEMIDISLISSFDTLMIKGVNNTIWSIQVLQSPGYIKLSNIPTREGTIEIDNNRIYTLEEIQDNITLSAGDHKVVIQMQGYESFAQHINISKGVVYEIDLKDAVKSISNLSINVVNTPTDYTIQIDNKRYKKGDIIQIQPGTYTLKLTAQDFKTVERQIKLEAGDQLIDITLEPKKEEIKPEEEKPKHDNNDVIKEEEVKTVQIIIETEPTGAQAFVSGVYKGTTPALTGLKPGEYSISIEKEGYSTLYTTIVIDAGNTQKSFLYTLQKE